MVLLRNLLHFLPEDQVERLPGLPRGMALQASIVRSAPRRADLIVVPCSQMGEHVIARMPWASERMKVRHHPITIRIKRYASDRQPYILFPSLPSIHKDLVGRLGFLLEAMEISNCPLQVWVTTSAGDLAGLDNDSRVVAVGPQTLPQMDELWAKATAVYTPSEEIESFGYPVAEEAGLWACQLSP